MNYWVVADTHFGHEKLRQWTGRPEGWDEKILQELPVILDNDIFIHLGDVCWYRHTYWHERMLEQVEGKRILVRGNHDKKTTSWYYDIGWDLVVDRFDLNIFGKHIAFTHVPLESTEGLINVHGHMHNTNHHDWEYDEGFHYTVHLEDSPSPQLLHKIIGR